MRSQESWLMVPENGRQIGSRERETIGLSQLHAVVVIIITWEHPSMSLPQIQPSLHEAVYKLHFNIHKTIVFEELRIAIETEGGYFSRARAYHCVPLFSI